MIKIIKHGNKECFTQFDNVTCPKCVCIFSYSSGDVHTKDVSNTNNWLIPVVRYVNCPDCGMMINHNYSYEYHKEKEENKNT